MSMNQNYGGEAIAEAHRRLETIKEDHKRQMFDEPDEERGNPDSRNRIIADVCEEVQELFPEPEPMEVRRFRSLLLSMDTVRNGADLETEPGDPLRVMQNVAIEYRDTALGAIENRLILERPEDEEDADVIYIHDPVTKVRHTTALGGYRAEYDYAMVENQKQSLAEQILYDPIPDTIPKV